MKSFDVIVVGGGMLGAAVSYGIAGQGKQVALLDEGDQAFRAARGNFGLVWVQSKGDGCPEYAGWTRRSSDLWPAFAQELEGRTGVDLGYSRRGGFDVCLDETELDRRAQLMHRLHNQGVGFQYEMMDRRQLGEALPGIGPEVVGGSYCPLDGHVNSLYLLRGLHTGFQRLGGHYFPGHGVRLIEPSGGGFKIDTGFRTFHCGRLVLAAGLANKKLGAMVGIDMPVFPNRGQILVTERIARFLEHPVSRVRQTEEGSVMLGDSKEDVGFDDGTTSAVMTEIAARAVRVFPFLKQARVVRSWGALRVMTPDGFPVYEQSLEHPGAFAISCHSGVTLAAAHAGPMAEALAVGRLPPDVAALGSGRFADA